jgi:hypothetical protein
LTGRLPSDVRQEGRNVQEEHKNIQAPTL